ncbi:MAG: hypothetical protein ACXVH1_36165 [Solirubrobacteraceae bacterium]
MGRRVGAAARAAAAAGARLPDVETSGTGLTGRLSLIASEKALASVGARLEDLVDPDVRAVVIRADHPELSFTGLRKRACVGPTLADGGICLCGGRRRTNRAALLRLDHCGSRWSRSRPRRERGSVFQAKLVHKV